MIQPVAYYNENDPQAAAWLESLILNDAIAPGVVDQRDILDVHPGDLDGFTQCHFFAGIGGWSVALRRAGWPDGMPVWTGSCPCQPFSAAGARRGFDDERHLWPAMHWLIAQRRPGCFFGEQVASAVDWIRLVRSDLEAVEYAVGVKPIEAASAGAYHLRDRWFYVADTARGVADTNHAAGERFGRNGGQILSNQESSGLDRAGDMGNASGARLPFGSVAENERRDIRGKGTTFAPSGVGGDDLADTHELGAREGRQQRGGQFRRATSPAEACTVGDGASERRNGSTTSAGPSWWPGAQDAGDEQWAIGADGKARRVKPGVRLLVDGFPARVGLLRGFGNAIDPRPATAFIKAYVQTRNIPLEPTE